MTIMLLYLQSEFIFHKMRLVWYWDTVEEIIEYGGQDSTGETRTSNFHYTREI